MQESMPVASTIKNNILDFAQLPTSVLLLHQDTGNEVEEIACHNKILI